MIFKPSLCDLIMSGVKTQTRRPVKYPVGDERIGTPMDEALPCRYSVGKTYAVQPGRGKPSICRIKVLSVERQALRDITQADAIAEGFGGCHSEEFPTDLFFDYWCRLYQISNNEIYSGLKSSQQVWRIEFLKVKMLPL